MNINFESLGKIDEIYNLLVLLKNEVNNKIEKRWLTSEELALYIGYSKESIKRFLKDGEFELNYHYFKKDRKNIFDKNAIDKWIMSENKGVSMNSEYLVNKLLSNVA
ncbi:MULTISPECIES: helix-turn-helix domain-containing protein [Aliarcobacter]|uniref:helix-turn-helix domain-containing protein n=1 Tax=Aliarcobacter TaxID=2321111 RepID=UPI0021B2420E|nr:MULTISPECIES: helix-turn-helix domain-containing protein [Aliarcobacter]MCT7444447.1 helix-turn-helix domain-containing protein [Aliarcobacter cryaerophilus]MCT7468316.1 helix-turn-helix domain-containing protein [Aliarcobacter cryaerophilus]MCT7479113.1 helix-turn-helix domain-containing protein [Aliarcobacter cryaerophilus]MCT7602630.1 helix-turn-helix domain-containing protein [Aliarcobacter butzleri]MCT7606821.1 helix-turn-helix domain-containing protein [Aliarcobacter butzleri]